MIRNVDVTEAQSHFDKILSQVQTQGDTVVIQKNGKPVAALISYPLFERFYRNHRSAYQVVLEIQQQNQDVEMNEDELLAFINEAVHEVRGQKGQ